MLSMRAPTVHGLNTEHSTASEVIRTLKLLILMPDPNLFSLANVVASRCRSEPQKLRFVSLSACTSGVADVKEAVSKAKNELALFNRQTVLFIDEVHRFNKLQQVCPKRGGNLNQFLFLTIKREFETGLVQYLIGV